MSGIAGRRIWRELCRPAQRKCAPSRLYMGAPSLHLVNAGQFLVHPLQCSGEDLLSVERAFGGAGEASTARIGLAPDLTLLLSCQSALLVAHLPQADAQCPQPLGVVFKIAGWCVTRMVSSSSRLRRLRSNLQETDMLEPPS